MRPTSGVAQPHVRDDRLLLATRVLSLLLVPFLLAAFGLLYLFPDHTGELFAWTIQPRMTAMLLGAAYLGGAYFFVRAATAPHWHWVQAGFLPVAAFATLMGIATLLHWDRFKHGHLAFLAWATLYFTTPLLVLAIWLRNRRTDPGASSNAAPTVAQLARWSLGGLGVAIAGSGLVLFLQPGLLIRLWPWMLTALTARVLGSLFVLSGVGGLTLALDSRWSAARISLQGQLVTVVAIAGAIFFSWNDFGWANPLAWAFVGGGLALALALALLLLLGGARHLGRQRARQTRDLDPRPKSTM